MLDTDQAGKELRMLRLPTVLERTAISRATLYRLVEAGTFPKPAKIGGSTVWPENEVNEFLQRALDAR